MGNTWSINVSPHRHCLQLRAALNTGAVCSGVAPAQAGWAQPWHRHCLSSASTLEHSESSKASVPKILLIHLLILNSVTKSVYSSLGNTLSYEYSRLSYFTFSRLWAHITWALEHTSLCSHVQVHSASVNSATSWVWCHEQKGFIWSMSSSGQGFTRHCNSQSPIFTYISSCTHASALEWQQLHLHNQGWVPWGLMLELSPPVQARRELSPLWERCSSTGEAGGAHQGSHGTRAACATDRKPSPATGCDEWLYPLRFISSDRAPIQTIKMINTFEDKVHIKKILVTKQNVLKFAIYYFLLEI